MRILDIQNEKQIETIREMKGIIKRYEHEVGQIAEQQHRDTEEFIRKLHRGRSTGESNIVSYAGESFINLGEENGNLIFSLGIFQLFFLGKEKEEKSKRTEQSPSNLIKVTEEESEFIHTKETTSPFRSKSPKNEIIGGTEKSITSKSI